MEATRPDSHCQAVFKAEGARLIHQRSSLSHKPVADAVRAIGVTEVTYYRWRNEYGGLKGDQVKRLKELEAENTRLRRAISDLTLDKLILQEAARGNF